MTMHRTFWMGACCFQVQLDVDAEPAVFRGLARVAQDLRASGLVDAAVPAYTSLAVYWLYPPSDADAVAAAVVAAVDNIDSDELMDATHHRVPVTYSGQDLQAVADAAQCSTAVVVEQHTAPRYVVAAVGFQENFAYLWGLSDMIATPRLASPRQRVPAGSVGIGGQQTGIYPRVSPGGWNIIGQTDPEQCQLFQVGDSVEFYPQ